MCFSIFQNQNFWCILGQCSNPVSLIVHLPPPPLSFPTQVHAELARRHAHANEVARQHWQACTDAYQAALRLPAGELGSFQERCDVRYNYACALALSGRVEEARMEIAALVQCGAVSMEDVHADEDLAGMV